MAINTYKVLGQIAPVAATLTDVYVVGADKQAVISTILVCNRGGTETPFRIAVRPDGEALQDKHYLSYDTPLRDNDTVTLTIGVSLDADDVISVYSTSGLMSFSVFGVEIT